MFDVNTNANINANINVNIYADADANVNILADACINILAHLTRTPTCSQSICDAYQFLPCKTASDEAVLHGLVGSGDVDENPRAAGRGTRQYPRTRRDPTQREGPRASDRGTCAQFEGLVQKHVIRCMMLRTIVTRGCCNDAAL